MMAVSRHPSRAPALWYNNLATNNILPVFIRLLAPSTTENSAGEKQNKTTLSLWNSLNKKIRRLNDGSLSISFKIFMRERFINQRDFWIISLISDLSIWSQSIFFYLIFPYPESSQTTYYNSIIKLFPSNNYETKNIVRAFYISVWPLFCRIIFQRKTDHN